MNPVTRQYFKAGFWCGAIIGLGVVLYKFTVPDPDKILAEMSPEVRKQAEKNRDLRMKEQEELMKIVKQTATSKEPIWKTGPIQSPWDPDYKQTTDSSLVKKQDFEKQKAADKQQKELAELKKQAEKTQELEQKEKQNKSWKFW